MFIKRIILNHYRNISHQELNFNERLNYIHGENGNGKTNLLEAISFITFGKSFINSPEVDCVQFNQPEFFIDSYIETEHDTVLNISLNYNLLSRKKSFFLNKDKVNSYSSEIFGRFPVVFYSPHSMNITYGNPSERRRFFDILLSQTSKVYLDFLKDLNKIIKLKNSLLRIDKNTGYNNNDFYRLLNSYDEKLVDVSSEIVYRRINFLDEFKDFFLDNFKKLIVNDETPDIVYYSEIFDGREVVKLNKDEISNILNKTILEIREQEISRGITLVGPHRDDYLFKLTKKNNKVTETFNIKNIASQGEHKTFVLALKLAEYFYIKDKLVINPILLLDDILSELDSLRVKQIISNLKDYGQIFLTTVEDKYKNEIINIYNNTDISFFKVISGNFLYEKN